jgi:hypothetical protein
VPLVVVVEGFPAGVLEIPKAPCCGAVVGCPGVVGVDVAGVWL